MEHLRLHCLTLQSLVKHTIFDVEKIRHTKDIIESLMYQFMMDGNVPEIRFGRYKQMSKVDHVFEALCHTIFDDIFKNECTKHQHGTTQFFRMLIPFYKAGVLCFSTGMAWQEYYLQRFRMRRYSYRHRVARAAREKDEKEQSVALDTALTLLRLSMAN